MVSKKRQLFEQLISQNILSAYMLIKENCLCRVRLSRSNKRHQLERIVQLLLSPAVVAMMESMTVRVPQRHRLQRNRLIKRPRPKNLPPPPRSLLQKYHRNLLQKYHRNRLRNRLRNNKPNEILLRNQVTRKSLRVKRKLRRNHFLRKSNKLHQARKSNRSPNLLQEKKMTIHLVERTSLQMRTVGSLMQLPLERKPFLSNPHQNHWP